MPLSNIANIVRVPELRRRIFFSLALLAGPTMASMEATAAQLFAPERYVAAVLGPQGAAATPAEHRP